MPHRYRDDLLEFCERKLMTVPGIMPAKMMGHPGWRFEHNNKFFLFVGENGIVLKLPPERYDEAMARDDVEAFNPMNGKKPMATWVEWIKPDAPEYDDDWRWFVDAAREYVAHEPANKPRKKN